MAKEEYKKESESQAIPQESGKPSETNTDVTDVAAQETDKSVEGESDDAPGQEDITDVIAILNAIDQGLGGKGELTSIPPELASTIKELVRKLVVLRDISEDPLWAAILDDIVDQKEDGQPASLKVAIARNVPLQELMELAESEDYAGTQKSLSDKLTSDKDVAAEDERIGMNFDKTKANFESYCAKNNYSDEEKSGLWEKVSMLMRVFGDGLLSEEEFAEVDKMRNYDSDVAGIKAQIPAGNKKEVLPDKASIDAAIYPGPKTESYKPRNQLESMAASAPSVDVTEIGKRKRRPGMNQF